MEQYMIFQKQCAEFEKGGHKPKNSGNLKNCKKHREKLKEV